MTAITFDTLKFVRKLESAGFSSGQAEAVAGSFRDASGEAEVVTRRDLRELELKIDSRFEQVKGELILIKWMIRKQKDTHLRKQKDTHFVTHFVTLC